MVIRPAREADLDAVDAIYDAILTVEEAGLTRIGWIRGVYPTRETAREALQRGTLYVLEDGGEIRAAAKIDQEQPEAYAEADWTIPAEEHEVLVLHTLVVGPAIARRGYGKAFVAFYEQEAKRRGCRALRIDTNETNEAARSLYAKLGYREADVVLCDFNRLANIRLVCLEKAVEA